jgi:hypothetical protein
MRNPVNHWTDSDSGVSGAHSRTRTGRGSLATHRCALVGSTSRQSAGGHTAYSQAATASSTTQAIRARRSANRQRRSAPMPASSTAMSWTTTPNRA